MLNYNSTYKIIASTRLKRWLDTLQNKVEYSIFRENFEEFIYWRDIFNTLPQLAADYIDLSSDIITISGKYKLSPENIKILKLYQPWRKGPFNIFGTFIDTEWRSNMKWNRVKKYISSLKNKLVLDVGCGNGYYSLRIRGENAKLVIGLEPYFLFVAQFALLQKYIKDPHVNIFPLKVEDMPDNLNEFDTIFSMGVLYHRISPIEHLIKLRSLLRDTGELVLETLVIDGKENEILFPKDRYSKMRNVWFIPSQKMIITWLKKVGFKNIRCVDITKTTFEEQRKTEWMQLESLSDFLNPNDLSKTVEDYSSPTRGIFICNK